MFEYRNPPFQKKKKMISRFLKVKIFYDVNNIYFKKIFVQQRTGKYVTKPKVKH